MDAVCDGFVDFGLNSFGKEELEHEGLFSDPALGLLRTASSDARERERLHAVESGAALLRARQRLSFAMVVEFFRERGLSSLVRHPVTLAAIHVTAEQPDHRLLARWRISLAGDSGKAAEIMAAAAAGLSDDVSDWVQLCSASSSVIIGDGNRSGGLLEMLLGSVRGDKVEVCLKHPWTPADPHNVDLCVRAVGEDPPVNGAWVFANAKLSQSGFHFGGEGLILAAHGDPKHPAYVFAFLRDPLTSYERDSMIRAATRTTRTDLEVDNDMMTASGTSFHRQFPAAQVLYMQHEGVQAEPRGDIHDALYNMLCRLDATWKKSDPEFEAVSKGRATRHFLRTRNTEVLVLADEHWPCVPADVRDYLFGVRPISMTICEAEATVDVFRLLAQNYPGCIKHVVIDDGVDTKIFMEGMDLCDDSRSSVLTVQAKGYTGTLAAVTSGTAGDGLHKTVNAHRFDFLLACNIPAGVYGSQLPFGTSVDDKDYTFVPWLFAALIGLLPAGNRQLHFGDDTVLVARGLFDTAVHFDPSSIARTVRKLKLSATSQRYDELPGLYHYAQSETAGHSVD